MRAAKSDSRTQSIKEDERGQIFNLFFYRIIDFAPAHFASILILIQLVF